MLRAYYWPMQVCLSNRFAAILHLHSTSSKWNLRCLWTSVNLKWIYEENKWKWTNASSGKVHKCLFLFNNTANYYYYGKRTRICGVRRTCNNNDFHFSIAITWLFCLLSTWTVLKRDDCKKWTPYMVLNSLIVVCLFVHLMITIFVLYESLPRFSNRWKLSEHFVKQLAVYTELSRISW